MMKQASPAQLVSYPVEEHTIRAIPRKQCGIAPNRIILAGFSQGGAMTIYCGLRHSKALAGIMALSTYLLLPDKMQGEPRRHANKGQRHTSLDWVLRAFAYIRGSRDCCF